MLAWRRRGGDVLKFCAQKAANVEGVGRFAPMWASHGEEI